MHDIFAETYGFANDWARRGYLAVINRAPGAWDRVYRWLDRREEFAPQMRWLFMAKGRLSRLLIRFQPTAVVSVYPAYPHLLESIQRVRPSLAAKVMGFLRTRRLTARDESTEFRSHRRREPGDIRGRRPPRARGPAGRAAGRVPAEGAAREQPQHGVPVRADRPARRRLVSSTISRREMPRRYRLSALARQRLLSRDQCAQKKVRRQIDQQRRDNQQQD